MDVRTIIIDDEPVARNLIKKFIKNDDDLVVVGECGNGEDAVNKILELKPDLIFLDIQMPVFDGMKVVEMIQDKYMPVIVFVTAYDQYAIKAFEINAVDYLLKPFDKERFVKALDRVKAKMETQSTEINIMELLKSIKNMDNYLDRLMIKSSGRVVFLKTEEIMWIEAAADYVSIHTEKEKFLHSDSMTNLESCLNPDKFIRSHRSVIVNIDYIKELKSNFNGQYVIIMKSGKELKLSRTYKTELFDKYKP